MRRFGNACSRVWALVPRIVSKEIEAPMLERGIQAFHERLLHVLPKDEGDHLARGFLEQRLEDFRRAR